MKHGHTTFAICHPALTKDMGENRFKPVKVRNGIQQTRRLGASQARSSVLVLVGRLAPRCAPVGNIQPSLMVNKLAGLYGANTSRRIERTARKVSISSEKDWSSLLGTYAAD
jgi:hypothetical protein